eukprot:CAMPEP_0172726716 /NCGR_PEP_ID=MMETSP1074-20121228/91275_1 /TAXON_ID=2916 /ORGANISM="Ceratium fusus, Strain PA161109" /LENGTH=129 /DNA_ID=CAMNT_0013553805 /DNA_START=1022 /DNA_END=1411 /DNA_ORIENTATION=-
MSQEPSSFLSTNEHCGWEGPRKTIQPGLSGIAGTTRPTSLEPRTSFERSNTSSLATSSAIVPLVKSADARIVTAVRTLYRLPTSISLSSGVLSDSSDLLIFCNVSVAGLVVPGISDIQEQHAAAGNAKV